MTNTLDPNINALWARAMVEELARSGMTDACISPGSRSTPLTLAFAQHPNVEVHVHVDERVAGFFALGMAKKSGRPVALVCTSGSAGAHYHPAFIEAAHANIPLIALTADRPQSLMDCGAGQTIEQKSFFGPHVREALHLDLPNLRPLALRHVRAAMDRLYAVSMGWQGTRPGPVHVNVPFEEPLAPVDTGEIDPTMYEDEHLAMHGRGASPLIEYGASHHHLSKRTMDELAETLSQARSPVIVCGPVDVLEWSASEAIVELARALRAPIIADPLSHMRWTGQYAPHVLAHTDAFLRSEAWAKAHEPDLVLRFGSMPTSKVYRFWREYHPEAQEWLVDPYGRLLDQVQQATRVLTANPEALATALTTRLYASTGLADTQWLDAWRRAECVARDAIHEAYIEEDAPLWEGPLARRVVEALPDGGVLMTASSMPVRDVDAFGGSSADTSPKTIKCIANRGANGIDGLLATSFGVAVHNDGPLVTIIGDVATLHDVGGLLASHVLRAAREDANVTIVLINNGGGGIFSFLPIAEYDAYFKPLFITPQDVDFSALASAYGLDYTIVRDGPSFNEALQCSVARSGIDLIEVIVDRETNVARHKLLWQHVSQTLERSLE